MLTTDFSELSDDELQQTHCPDCGAVGVLKRRTTMPHVIRCQSCLLWLHPDFICFGGIDAPFVASPHGLVGGNPRDNLRRFKRRDLAS